VSLLQVADLSVTFPTDGQPVRAVRGVSLHVDPGEVVAIVGESGSGKSATAMAVIGLLPEYAEVSGSVRMRGTELLGMSDNDMSRIRGASIGTVFQDPMSALTPVYTVGDQIAEAVTVHRPQLGRGAARSRAVELLDLVGIAQPDRRARAFPHELSGGERQRVVIAIAIANDPDLLICDEPTTALDVTVQAQILWLLRDLQQRLGLAVIFVTHDLGVAAEIADDAAVMYGGRIVEQAPVRALFRAPAHPYTEGLMQATVRRGQKGRALVPIPGAPPNLVALPPGCAFAMRCPHVRPVCEETLPPLHAVSADHVSRCHLVPERFAAPLAALAASVSRQAGGD
jgi:peptide/nickel transport system ATP-binding protein